MAKKSLIAKQKRTPNIKPELTHVAQSVADHTQCSESMAYAEFVLEKWLTAGKFLA